MTTIGKSKSLVKSKEKTNVFAVITQMCLPAQKTSINP